MNDRPDLGGLRDDLDLPPTRVAEGAWDRGRRRVRRRRAAGAAAVVALVAAILVPTLADGGGDAPRGLDPARAPSGTTVTLTTEAFDRLIDQAVTVEGVDDVPLAENPVDHAAYAVSSSSGDVLVMGPDGRYRRVPAPDDGTAAVQSTSLNPSATRLALALPDAVHVVDLTTGATSTVDLKPGGDINTGVGLASWADDSTVLVTNGDRASVLVDVDTGRTVETGLAEGTAFTPDGPMRWTGSEVTTADAVLETGITLDFGVPLAGDDIVVGSGSWFGTGVSPSSDGRRPTTGAVVMDLETGGQAAALVLEAPYYVETLRLEGDEIIIRVDVRGAPLVVAWDWRRGEVRGVAMLGPFLVTKRGVELPTPRDQEFLASELTWGTGWED